MNAHDPDAPETDPGRTSSPLPRRTAALDALGPVPAPRTPGDGPLRPRPNPAPPVPTARHEVPPQTPRTPPMPWSAVAAPAEPPPPPRPPAPPTPPTSQLPRTGARRRIEWTVPSWWPEVRRFLARPTERRLAVGLAVTVVLVGSAALTLSLVTAPPGEEQVVAEQQSGAPVAGDVAGGATVVDGAAFGTDAWSFRSPTGNIECRMADDGSRCTVRTRNWPLPPSAPDCPPANGTAVLAGSGPAFASCEPSSARSARALDYGEALRRDDVTCVSERDGVECRDGSTGHGFSVARADYRVY